MGRWVPDARGRLEQAALDLYTDKGFDQTTVTEIAERAGLTQRTFFRHFADKREVLFSGADTLQELLASAVANAPRHISPMDTIIAALEAAAREIFQDRRAYARQRQEIIAQDPGLRERELIKLASLVSVLADGLRRRGVADATASLTAEAGIVLFKVTFERWLEGEQDMPQLLQETRDELRTVTSDS